MVQKRMRRLGVVTPCYGPHALRHACATHLLAKGFSLKEMKDGVVTATDRGATVAGFEHTVDLLGSQVLGHGGQSPIRDCGHRGNQVAPTTWRGSVRSCRGSVLTKV